MKPKGPGRLTTKPVKQMKNFVKGIEQMANTRLQICHNCSHWDRTFKRCKKCGCFTSAKARMPNAKCPANLWPV